MTEWKGERWVVGVGAWWNVPHGIDEGELYGVLEIVLQKRRSTLLLPLARRRIFPLILLCVGALGRCAVLLEREEVGRWELRCRSCAGGYRQPAYLLQTFL